jgi:hypothetical protein
LEREAAIFYVSAHDNKPLWGASLIENHIMEECAAQTKTAVQILTLELAQQHWHQSQFTKKPL